MEFNAPFNPGKQTIENILSLRREQVFTIVTGQQLCLFGGPLYTLFKTLSVISISAHLRQQAGLHVVPVFWMADEDHDYDEIRFSDIPGKNHSLEHITLGSDHSPQAAAGKRVLDEELSGVLDQLAGANGKRAVVTQDLLKLLSDWQPGRQWKEAFGRMMLRLFGHHGLVLAGSENKAIKEAVAPVLDKTLQHHSRINELISTQTRKMAESYHAQAATTGSHLFWHDERMGRTKLDFSPDGWTLPPDNQQLDPQQAAVAVAENNSYHRLSPNVFLRPVLQEYLLPNLAYVGGGAELAYHGQLKPLFEFFGLPMPLLLPRLSATVVEPAIQKAMKAFDFELTDYRRPARELHREWAETSSAYLLEDEFTRWQGQLNQLFEDRNEYIKSIDETLTTSAESTKVRMRHELDTLRTKVVRAVKLKEKTQVGRITRVHNSLFPQEVLQERKMGFIYLYAAYGPEFADKLLEQMSENPLEFIRRHQIIYI